MATQSSTAFIGCLYFSCILLLSERIYEAHTGVKMHAKRNASKPLTRGLKRRDYVAVLTGPRSQRRCYNNNASCLHENILTG